MSSAETDRVVQPLDFVRDGIAIFGTDGKVVWVDDGLRRILGLDGGTAGATHAEVVKRIQFGGAEPLAEVLAKLAATGEWQGEGAGLTADDHAVFLEVTGRRLEQDPPGWLGAILVFRDATRQRMMECRVLESQQMELVEKLTRGIAHEFKNLLTIIMAYGSLLELQFEGTEHGDEIAKIMETAERANLVTRRLVAITRRPQLDFESTDLQVIMAEVNALITKALPSQLRVNTVEPRRMPMVYVEPGSLIRAVVHLALNASEAMPDGGDLTVDTEVVDISAVDVETGHPARTPGQYVVISVTDTGLGMSPETQARMFEPFYTTKEDGSGLGLCFAKQVIEGMNGVLHVYSEPGSGTTVKLYLPVIGSQGEEDGEVPPSGSETILVVDDDRMAQGVLRTMLELAGFSVWVAASGAEALAQLDEHGDSLDLVVLDVVMPDMNGDEVYARMKATHPNLKVVLTSGFPPDTMHGVLRDELPRLSKPFTRQNLLATVRAALDG